MNGQWKPARHVIMPAISTLRRWTSLRIPPAYHRGIHSSSLPHFVSSADCGGRRGAIRRMQDKTDGIGVPSSLCPTSPSCVNCCLFTSPSKASPRMTRSGANHPRLGDALPLLGRSQWRPEGLRPRSPTSQGWRVAVPPSRPVELDWRLVARGSAARPGGLRHGKGLPVLVALTQPPGSMSAEHGRWLQRDGACGLA